MTKQEQHEIEEELKKFPNRQATCIEAMAVVQRHRGWLCEENIRDVAQMLGLDPAEVLSTASFYNLFYRRARGRHVIHVCDSVSCWILGASKICELLSRQLGIRMGETTPDGRFTLLPIVCLGACDHAPVMLIDDDLHRDVTDDSLDQILARYS